MVDFTTFLNDVVVILGAGGFVKWLIKNGPTVVKEVEDVAKAVVATPAGKVIEAELHHKLDAVTAQFKQSEIGRLAAEALNYTEKDLHELSDLQVNALATKIFTMLPKDFNFSESQIVEALKAAQKASDAIAADPMIEAADKFTEEKAQAVKQVNTIGEQTQTPA